ncbi:hypothetical protein SeLEV6574_g07271 [Synchytrium endobioticum]|nr:hypothetical protein SeLEV6574_g07271 [Synchytrium endobioticum]
MDMIVKLPPSLPPGRLVPYDSILEVVGRRSKMGHFIPTKEGIHTEEPAQLAFDHIICKHGVPKTMITDRGPQFKICKSFVKDNFDV